MINPSRISIAIIVLLIFNACATYNPQYKNKNFETQVPDKELAHSFYFIGDAGNSPSGGSTDALVAFKNALKEAPENSTAIFLGDNIYEKGLPKKTDENYDLSKHRLDAQLETTNDFNGQAYFIPGNHDWYSGVKGLKRQEEYVEKALGKNTFLPENGCPIEKVSITRDIDLIIVDSAWYISNWDQHPTINDDCDIKTRAAFLDEFGSLIKKARGRTTIVAIHHPMFTNGSHGGQYSFGSHMRPLPVLGTLKNIIRKTSGVANVDTQNVRYSELRRHLVTLAQQNDKVVLVSGHEHNLQHIISDNLHQVVSGSGSKTDAVRNLGGGQFAYASPGYAVLDIYRDGSSNLRFHSTEKKDVVYRTEIFQPNEKKSFTTYPKNFPKIKSASIYSE
ncbi:MAG: metallophosphoesterase, partial [Bacteroidia bacterium]|nr:metallophosphoesterase [Bacteroidia bacterium]